ncbi:MAG: OadG family protein [Clostridia bacterium]|nr:OadG family protein [Clostridia bacterium]
MELSFVDTLLVAVVGMVVVFFGLVVLILLINLMQALTSNLGKKEEASAAPAAPVAAPVVAAPVADVVKPLVSADTKVTPAKIDDQTVAVLTAAIAAIRGEGYPFNIRRIVRVNKAQ